MHFHSRKCIWKCRLRNDVDLSRPQCVKLMILFCGDWDLENIHHDCVTDSPVLQYEQTAILLSLHSNVHFLVMHLCIIELGYHWLRLLCVAYLFNVPWVLFWYEIDMFFNNLIKHTMEILLKLYFPLRKSQRFFIIHDFVINMVQRKFIKISLYSVGPHLDCVFLCHVPNNLNLKDPCQCLHQCIEHCPSNTSICHWVSSPGHPCMSWTLHGSSLDQ